MSEDTFNEIVEYDPNDPDDEQDYDVDDTLNANKNTKRKTETDMRIFSAYLVSMKEKRPAEDITPEELDRYLSTFFSVVKKHDGNEYEPASLRGMLCSIERYLRIKGYLSSVTRDITFLNTRNTLKAKQRKLRDIGKGSKKIQPEPLGPGTIEKLNHLYDAKELGPFNPMAIINSLCFAFVVHFRMRKAIDHKQLLWGDVGLRSTNRSEYLTYEPMDGYDNIRSKLKANEGLKIWAHSPDAAQRDPVSVYKVYASKRPSAMMTPDSPFYLGMATMHPLPSQPWYKSLPMGVNKLNDLVRMIREITGIPRAVNNSPIEALLVQPNTCILPQIVPAIRPAYQPNVAESIPYTTAQNRIDAVQQPIFQTQNGVRMLKGSEDENMVVTAVDLTKSDWSDHTTEKVTSLSETKERMKDLMSSLENADVPKFVDWLKDITVTQDSNTGTWTINTEEDESAHSTVFQMTFEIDRRKLFDQHNQQNIAVSGHAKVCRKECKERTHSLQSASTTGCDSVPVAFKGQSQPSSNADLRGPVDISRKRTGSADAKKHNQALLQRTHSFPESMTLNEYMTMMKHAYGAGDASRGVGGSLNLSNKRLHSSLSLTEEIALKKTRLEAGENGSTGEDSISTNDVSQTQGLSTPYTTNAANPLHTLPKIFEASLATSHMFPSAIFPHFQRYFGPLADPRTTAMMLASHGGLNGEQHGSFVDYNGLPRKESEINNIAPQEAHTQHKSITTQNRAESADGKYQEHVTLESRDAPLPAHQVKGQSLLPKTTSYNNADLSNTAHAYNFKKET